MSYKDKPILKLYKYINGSFVMQAQIDDFQECSFEHNLYQAGTFTITINYNIPNALLFQRGLFVQFGSNPHDFGEIITIQDSIGQDGKGSQIRTITGYDSRYILKRRVIKNMNSNGLWAMTDKGEIVLRTLIKDQCGSSAEAKRQLPISNTIPASADAKGKEYSASENFSNLYEVCKTIATQSEIGWRMSFDGSSLSLEVFEGADLSQTVRFDTSYESLANGEFQDSSDSFSNAIYIGGKGQNDDRDIYEGEDGTPEGLDRFESWDNQSSLTVESEYEAEALSMLTQYGQTLTMNGNGLAKCPYVFREQYDIGDTVTVAFSGKSAKAQILSITEHWSWGAYDISFAFGKPQNNLSDQLQLMLRKIQEASNKTNSTDSVRWYTIPTDTAMPKADVTYNTIGFVGTVGTGATFTLYLDNEKTGAKTYHVYFKQLGGTGKLTLTTGVSGATNLTLNTGTYVAIIYVDENGNVTNTASTPTSTIEAGSTQPATSSGVSQAIENVTSNFSDLPKDAELHYSFDDVPDFPDGSADVRILDGQTYQLQYGNYAFNPNDSNATSSNDNGTLVCNINNSAFYLGSSYFNKIFKCKIQVTAISGTLAIHNGYQNIVMRITEVGTYELTILNTNSQTYKNIYFYCNASGYSCTFKVLKIYCGDGSYSTPIIDNANGQWNSKYQSGVAVQGISGKAYKTFTSQYVDTGKSLTEDFAISIWINPDNDTSGKIGNIIVNNQIIIRNGADWANNLMIYVMGADGNWDINYTPISSALPPNVWSHFVITKNGNSVKVYLNGVLLRSLTMVQGLYKNGTNLALGNTTNTRPQSYDDLLIFDRALSEQEVKALYLNKANTPKYYDLNNYQIPFLLPKFDFETPSRLDINTTASTTKTGTFTPEKTCLIILGNAGSATATTELAWARVRNDSSTFCGYTTTSVGMGTWCIIPKGKTVTYDLHNNNTVQTYILYKYIE